MPKAKKLLLLLVVALSVGGVFWSFVMAAAPSPVKVQFRNPNTAESLSQLDPWYKITANQSIDLSKLTIRYFYTAHNDKQQGYAVDWTSLSPNTVTGKFVKMSPAADKADYYFETGFSGGSLSAGQSIEVNNRIFKSDGAQDYKQSQNYSFAGSAALSTHIDWDKIAVYYSGSLVQGTPPGGSGVPAATATPNPVTPATPTPTTPATQPTPTPTQSNPGQGGGSPVNSGDITLQLKNPAPDHPNTIFAWYKLFNHSGDAINLSRVTIRYIGIVS